MFGGVLAEMSDPPTAVLFQYSCINICSDMTVDGNDDNRFPIAQCRSEVFPVVRRCAEFLQRPNHMRQKPMFNAVKV